MRLTQLEGHRDLEQSGHPQSFQSQARGGSNAATEPLTASSSDADGTETKRRHAA